MVRRALAGHAATDFRPDIEGLRAIAVLAVVLYHVRLPGVRGGFVGVDVFFVVSGFLITRLLLAELAATGTVSRQRFWARRARRILPAATLTVVVTVVLAHSVLAPLALPALGADAIGAGTFTINFVFAHRLGDYFGAQLGATNPSPLLHYWSLAVEEQFYLLWPALLVLLTRRPAQYRRLLAVTVAALAAIGFVTGMWLTAQHPSWAFFLLPARMGELLGGAGLAVAAGAVLRLAAPWRAALGWVGLAGIVVACSMLDESVPWPGRAVLLPVLATMAVIVSGTAPMTVSWAPLRLLRVPSLQWLGRHSFALYLWHWPLLVLAQARWGPLTWPERIVLVGLAVALSAASVRFVEDPVRHARTLSARPALSLALGAALCAGHRRPRRATALVGRRPRRGRHRGRPRPRRWRGRRRGSGTDHHGRRHHHHDRQRHHDRHDRGDADDPGRARPAERSPRRARGIDATGAPVVVGPGGGAEQPRSSARLRTRPLGAVRRRVRERRA